MENKRLKILHVITSLRTGGAERLMVDLLPRMQEAGHQVDLCVFDGIRTPFTETLEKKGVKIISLSHSMYSPVNIIKLIPLIRKYDIIHTHNTPCQFAVALLKRLTNAILVTTEHNTTNRRRSNNIWYPLDKCLYSNYKKVICISERARTNLVNYLGENCDKYITINNGIDINAFMGNKATHSYDNKITITMVAAFREQKDQKTLIQALELLPNSFHLQLVGDGELRQHYENWTQELSTRNRIRFLGNRSDIPEILQSSDIIVLSSHYEGLSLSCLEGLAAGKPFIASDVEGIHDIVSGYGILFPEGDACTLAQIILELQASEEYSSQVAKRCQERASQFSIENTLEEYLNIYKGICK